MSVKLSVWMIFSILLSLLPVVFNVLVAIFVRTSKPFIEVIEGGELLLIAGTLRGSATGELLASGRAVNAYRVVAGGVSISMLVFCSFLYATIKFIRNKKVVQRTSLRMNTAAVAYVTVFPFVAGVLSSTSCIYLAEVRP